jgi:hypothetical protein
VVLPGATAPASIALRVIRARKPLQGKAEVLEEESDTILYFIIRLIINTGNVGENKHFIVLG